MSTKKDDKQPKSVRETKPATCPRIIILKLLINLLLSIRNIDYSQYFVKPSPRFYPALLYQTGYCSKLRI